MGRRLRCQIRRVRRRCERHFGCPPPVFAPQKTSVQIFYSVLQVRQHQETGICPRQPANSGKVVPRKWDVAGRATKRASRVTLATLSRCDRCRRREMYLKAGDLVVCINARPNANCQPNPLTLEKLQKGNSTVSQNTTRCHLRAFIGEHSPWRG